MKKVKAVREPKRNPIRREGLPETGFVRLAQIIGNPNAAPPIPGVIPIAKSSWYAGIKAGKYPAPVRLGQRTVCWRVEDIHALIERVGEV